MTPSGIEPATFRFVAQHLNHCATAVPFLLLPINVNTLQRYLYRLSFLPLSVDFSLLQFHFVLTGIYDLRRAICRMSDII